MKVKFSPDGQTVATGSDTVRLWDVRTKKRKKILDCNLGEEVEQESEEVEEESAQEHGQSPEQETGQGATKETTEEPQERSGLITCLAFSQDGQTVASGSFHNIMWLWNTPTEEGHRLLEDCVDKESPDKEASGLKSFYSSGFLARRGNFGIWNRLWRSVAVGHTNGKVPQYVRRLFG